MRNKITLDFLIIKTNTLKKKIKSVNYTLLLELTPNDL